jgi:hypothetical protein
MASPQHVENALLIAGILHNDSVDADTICATLHNELGAIHRVSTPHVFTETTYYHDEMGTNLTRFYLAWSHCIHPDELPAVKLHTNNLENYFSTNNKRNVNIDPGLLTPHSLILASCKDFTQRVYLKNGVFAEVTLIVRNGSLAPLPWTYPDYAAPRTRAFFDAVRYNFLAARKTGNEITL